MKVSTNRFLLSAAFVLALALSPNGSSGQAVSDFDLDGVPDELDNCIEVPNGPLLGLSDVAGPYYVPQQDSDEDGYGNACDPDFNNDGANGLDDCSRLLASIASVNPADEELDMNSDGAPGWDDLTLQFSLIGSSPGPSGLACAAANQKFTCPPAWP